MINQKPAFIGPGGNSVGGGGGAEGATEGGGEKRGGEEVGEREDSAVQCRKPPYGERGSVRAE